MSLFLFTKKILDKKNIDVFNYGKHFRDFTFIDDVVKGIYLCAIKGFSKTKKIHFKIFNIASGKPIKLTKFIKIIETKLKLRANKKFLKLQKGDVIKTYGSIKKISSELGYKPKTSINQGVSKFIDWYMKFYKFDKKKNAN
jgi:Nucleoside-diphosphate-sugar epimerases